MPVNMPTYPAKFVDLKTVLLFFLNSRFTTRGFSFSVMIHDLFFISQLWGGTNSCHEMSCFLIILSTIKLKNWNSHPINNPKSRFLPWMRLPEKEQRQKPFSADGASLWSSLLNMSRAMNHLYRPRRRLMCTRWTPRRRCWTRRPRLQDKNEEKKKIK